MSRADGKTRRVEDNPGISEGWEVERERGSWRGSEVPKEPEVYMAGLLFSWPAPHPPQRRAFLKHLDTILLRCGSVS